jgi:hypothetical protein
MKKSRWGEKMKSHKLLFGLSRLFGLFRLFRRGEKVCLVYSDNAVCFVHFVDFVCFVGEEVYPVGLRSSSNKQLRCSNW